MHSVVSVYRDWIWWRISWALLGVYLFIYRLEKDKASLNWRRAIEACLNHSCSWNLNEKRQFCLEVFKFSRWTHIHAASRRFSAFDKFFVRSISSMWRFGSSPVDLFLEHFPIFSLFGISMNIDLFEIYKMSFRLESDLWHNLTANDDFQFMHTNAKKMKRARAEHHVLT